MKKVAAALLLSTMAALSGVLATPALAATDHVTNCNNSGSGSLPVIVAAATSGDTIVFDQDCSGGSTITLSSPISISGTTLTITGSGHSVTISGGGSSQIFTVAAGATLTLLHLTLTNGSASSGGAIGNAGSLTARQTTFMGNSSPGSEGGAISSSGSLTLRQTTFSANSSSVQGGAIDSSTGTLTVSLSTFDGNSANGPGGAIENAGTATIQTSTFTGNSSNDFGGAISNGGSLTLERSTLSGNNGLSGGAIGNAGTLNLRNSTLTGNMGAQCPGCGGNGGGLSENGGTATLQNDTLSDNSALIGDQIAVISAGTLSVANTIVSGTGGTNNCVGTITDGGYNLQFGDTSCGFSDHAVTADPLLGSLASNGGPTQTMALGEGSPAIGAGSATVCQSAGIGNIDQRGKPRHADTRTVCDIGAYDTLAGPPSGATTLMGRSPSVIVADGTSTSTITVIAKDVGGNRLRIGGAVVQLSPSMGTLGAVTDHHDGSYSATLTSATTVGAAQVTGTIDGNPIAASTIVYFVPGPPSGATTTISSSPSSIPADGSSTSTITVRAKDASGNLIQVGGANVQLDTTLGTLSGVTDLGNGKYTATLTSAVSPGTATISGTINGDPITATTTVKFTS